MTSLSRGNQTDITEEQSRTDAAIASQTEVKVQRRYKTVTDGANGVTLTDLEFANLEIGKWYRCSIQMIYDGANNTGWMGLEAWHNGLIIGRCSGQEPLLGDVPGNQSSFIFQATVANITFVQRSISGNSILGGSQDQTTYTELEELPNHSTTTQWTP
jgi:hypothetical protein